MEYLVYFGPDGKGEEAFIKKVDGILEKDMRSWAR